MHCMNHVNLWPRTVQPNSYLPVWVFVCSTRSCLSLNMALQSKHWRGFSALWQLMWQVRLDLRPNLCSQREQLYGFSPVCVLMCSASVYFLLNAALQTEHLKGRSPVWTRLCLNRSARWLKVLPHSEQLWSFFLLSQAVLLTGLFCRESKPDSLSKDDCKCWSRLGSRLSEYLLSSAWLGRICDDRDLFWTSLVFIGTAGNLSCVISASSSSSLICGGLGCSWTSLGLELLSWCKGSTLITNSCWTPSETRKRKEKKIKEFIFNFYNTFIFSMNIHWHQNLL